MQNIQSQTPVPVYVLKEYQGKVSVYKYNHEEPYAVTDIVVDTLPPYDQETLIKGINVYSEEQLTRLLEDFDS